MADFDGLKPSFTVKQHARQKYVSALDVGIARMRQLCTLHTQLDAAQPTLFADLIAAATPAQEAKLRAFHGLMQTFADADPQSDPVPDLPAP